MKRIFGLAAILLVSACAYQPRINATRPTTKPGYAWASMQADLETCERRTATISLMDYQSGGWRGYSAATIRQENFEFTNACLRDKGWQ